MEKKTIIGITFAKEGEKNVNVDVLEEEVEAVKEYATSRGYKLKSEVTINALEKQYEQTKAKDYQSFFPTQYQNKKNIGTKFKLRVYSNRWGHGDNYNLTKTEDGWLVSYLKETDSPCDKGGVPTLQKALESESISYPADLEYFISDIWDASENRSAEEVQSYFDKLAAWISETEKAKPNFSPLHL